MTHTSNDENLSKLKGSEQHHDLKNRPGEKGDKDHVAENDKEFLSDTDASDKK